MGLFCGVGAETGRLFSSQVGTVMVLLTVQVISEVTPTFTFWNPVKTSIFHVPLTFPLLFYILCDHTDRKLYSYHDVNASQV